MLPGTGVFGGGNGPANGTIAPLRESIGGGGFAVRNLATKLAYASAYPGSSNELQVPVNCVDHAAILGLEARIWCREDQRMVQFWVGK